MNSTEESAYRYTGREYDDETDLHKSCARLYDSTLMRFYQVDPAEQFASPYVYCGNNPIMQLDFAGKISEKIQQAAKGYNNIPYVGFECNVYVYTAVTEGEGWTDFPRNLWDLDGRIGQATYFKQRNVFYENIDQAWAVLDVGDIIISGGGYYPSGGHTVIVDEVTYDDKGNKTGFFVTGSWNKDTDSGRGKYSYRSIQHYLDKVPVNPNFWGLASLNNNEVPIGRDSDYSKSKSSSVEGSAIPNLDNKPYDRINPRDFGVPDNGGWINILDDWNPPLVQ
ncbi:MAG: RHS repeat-associated core domain-containing protein [Candidatus Cloacimonetes bacterium]|jgi:RHS repeat-associated protein|nr:RHS repeat-associated core domain-containing protein [Candidatus Cloacimonadota bacterium]